MKISDKIATEMLILTA